MNGIANIKALLFDLGKVLVDFDPAIAHRKVAELTGLSIEAVAALLVHDDIQFRYEKGLLSTKDLHLLFTKASGSRFSEAQLAFAASDIFSPIEASVVLLRKLRANGYRTVMVSNTCPAHIDYCEERFDLFTEFDAKIYSYAIKAMKPEPTFYEAAWRAAGCDKDECLFVDDLSVNIEGARKFGFHGILFRSPEQLKDDLRTFSVRLD